MSCPYLTAVKPSRRKFFVVLWCLLLDSVFCARTLEDERALIGWKGDTFNPKSVFAKAPTNGSRAIQISAKPLAYIHDDLLTAEEAKHLVELAAPRMKRSMVGSNHSITEVRTSYGMFIPRYQDEIVARLEERVANWTGIPVSHQEDIQVLRYAEGQQYKPHMDANGRICTVLIYLADTESGGETAFPKTHKSNWLDPALDAAQSPRSRCAAGHVAVKPKRGLGLLFWSMPPDALYDPSQRRVDPYSEHTGCPPITGYKWTLTIWIHYEPFRPEVALRKCARRDRRADMGQQWEEMWRDLGLLCEHGGWFGLKEFATTFKPPMPDPALCADYNDSCKLWSARGECEKNAAYMVGSSGSMGHCRKACGVCYDCPAGDSTCLEESRVKQGFLPELEKELKILFSNDAVADAQASERIGQQ